MIDFIFASVGFMFGFVSSALLNAHKFKGTVLGRKGQEVTVVTTKGERTFVLALDLTDRDTYAILQTNTEDTHPVTFAMKAEQVKL